VRIAIPWVVSKRPDSGLQASAVANKDSECCSAYAPFNRLVMHIMACMQRKLSLP
jgi:hypothetical protein